jgi:TonB family protein
VQTNWLQNTIDPAVRQARTAHAVVAFTIYRDGTVKDIKVSQTSGNLSMDNSGLRALMASNPMPALPPDYRGSYVTVLFDFDLSMTR